MKFRRGNTGEKFKSGIQRFGGPYRNDCQNDPAPFWLGELEIEADYNYDDRRGRMNPGVMLGRNHYPNTFDCTPEATNSSGESQAFFRFHR